MGTVTGYTAEKMEEIVADNIVDGEVVGDDLHLLTRGGTTIDAGSVRGPTGDTGATGEVEEAPVDGARYVRKDADWVEALLGIPEEASVTTSQTRSTTSFGDLATAGPHVDVTIGASGAALVIITSKAVNDNASGGAHVGFAVSGATTIAADSNKAIQAVSNTAGIQQGSVTYLVTGLTAGVNTFTLKYRADVAGTATFANRHITVFPLGS